MVNDFSHTAYRQLLEALQQAGYRFLTFGQYLQAKASGSALPEKYVMLRHDVDQCANDSTKISNIEYSQNVRASYFYRAWILDDPRELLAVKAVGHEIGYHYEDLVTAEGDLERAIGYFEQHLNKLRLYADVSTICMHGSPRSKYDSKALWQRYDYHDYGLQGEPYFDLDLSQVCYLTDTGGRWDGYRFSVRDKMPDRYQHDWESRGWRYHSTFDLIAAIRQGSFPPHVMLTTHPQRWSDS
ncbi:MAG: hypothetical protein J6Y77_04775, partial [Paludibacteraceae bacterium]|nr:hypothetical protein [Paludibacteraceae bacterium]